MVYILPIVNAASLVGCIVPNYVADHIEPRSVQAPAIALSGILVLAWIPAHAVVLFGILAETRLDTSYDTQDSFQSKEIIQL